jgi:endonuclease/exonuclease/phosphatase family metal-dependent hydrolase
MRRALSLLVLSTLLLACGSGADPSAASAASSADTAAQGWWHGGPPTGVLTRNLYLGADLTPVIQSGSFPEFLAATTAAWTMVERNDFHVRARAIAQEIAWTRPALIGLQEAYTWRIQDPGDALLGGTTPATTVVYDYVPEILAALQRMGLHYRLAAEVELFDFEAPIATGQDVRLTDHGAVLARADVQTQDAVGQVFSTLLPVQVLGQTVPVKRGWASVQARVHGGPWFRFVTVHLEAYHPVVRTVQAQELAAALAGETGPVVLVGDLNSHPGEEGEAVLAAAGFTDTWGTLYPARPGFSCCWLEDLTISSPPAPPLDERIDYVMIRGPVRPFGDVLLGDRPWERERGLWPSDHAGLAAWVNVGAQR